MSDFDRTVDRMLAHARATHDVIISSPASIPALIKDMSRPIDGFMAALAAAGADHAYHDRLRKMLVDLIEAGAAKTIAGIAERITLEEHDL